MASIHELLVYPTGYTIRLDERTVCHATIGAMYRIGRDDVLSELLIPIMMSAELRKLVLERASAAVRQERDRDRWAVGTFQRGS